MGESLDLGAFDLKSEARKCEDEFRERHGIPKRKLRVKMEWVIAHLSSGDFPALVTRTYGDGSKSLTIFIVGDIVYRDGVKACPAGLDDEEKYGYYSATV